MPTNTSALQKLTPTNLKEEQEKFFFDPSYNPQFLYEDEIDAAHFTKYGPASDQYLSTSINILDSVVKKWSDGEEYNEDTQGELLSQTEVEEYIQKYLKRNNLQDRISYNFSSAYISRTSVYKNVLQIQTPLSYRENGLESVLDHEIGTHVFRRMNEEKQPWHKHKTRWGFSNYLRTEEGLAVINSQLSLPDKHLFYPAVNYYAACQAEKLSFSDLFADLKKYISNKQKRFTICMKVKRGLSDTSVPGAYTKNQVYLAGTIAVAQWLINNDYAVEKLYVGKIDLADLPKAWAQTSLSVADLRLPTCIQDRVRFKASLVEIIETNDLPVKVAKK